jgi:CDP-diacylglycerol--serine O-phosphatidyltransferase
MAEPAKDKGAGRPFQPVPVRFLLPNLVTLLALCSGVTSIRLAMEGRFEIAVAAVVLAIFLDAVDGRLARLLKGTSRFGAELDSLADFVNFGVAPAILIYTWSLNFLKPLGWIVALMLAVACALRLARFNIALDDPAKPTFANAFFTGVPAPAGAGLAMAPLYLDFLDVIPDGRPHGQSRSHIFRKDDDPHSPGIGSSCSCSGGLGHSLSHYFSVGNHGRSSARLPLAYSRQHPIPQAAAAKVTCRRPSRLKQA